ncbi:hypothetical protein [Novipirellula caenicola]|uniref:Uncharacterized protein n=1 Tax=Novipirellula caenicola TaxID=1536901 RepID=A0ABP9W0S0_9BACT
MTDYGINETDSREAQARRQVSTEECFAAKLFLRISRISMKTAAQTIR